MKITDEQIERANYVNLPQFLMMHGFDLKKVGREYVWKEHDSLHIRDNAPGERGRWYRFSESKGGDNISFLREYMNMSFADAVEALTGEYIDRTYTAPTRTYQPKPIQQTARELSLAEADNCRRVFAYLCKTRGLDYDLISSLVKSGVIAQEQKTGNVLFKYYDENGKIIGAEKVGTSTEHKFKGIATGSAGGHGFEIVRGTGENAFFFESAIDMLSYLQMHDKELTNCRLVSMMGVKPNIVLDTMRRHNISPENVFLCSDNDTAGNEFADRLREEYPDMKRIITSDTYKDWNDMLRGIPKITEQKKEADMQLYGNKMWNDATDNRDKSLISIQSSDFQRVQDALENSGINYYAYEMNGTVRMAVNDKDTDWLRNILGDVNITKSNRPFSPPEKNIIGNAEYRYIPQKEYLSADRDLVLKMAEIMTQRGIKFSGRIYPTGKGTLTVSHNDIYAVREIQKSVIEMRKQFGTAEKGQEIGNQEYRQNRDTHFYMSKLTPEQFSEIKPFLETSVNYHAVAKDGKVAFAVDKENASAFHRALQNAEREVGLLRNVADLGLSIEQNVALSPVIHRLAVEDMQFNLADFFDKCYDNAQFGEMLSLVNAYLAQSPAERYGEHSKLSEMLEAKSSFDRAIELSDFFSQHDFSDEQRAAITAMFVGDVTRGQIDSIDETFTVEDIQAYNEILHNALQESDVAQFLTAHKQAVINRENAERVPTEEEVLFPKADLAKFIAERTLSSDEWEDMAYPLFENGYLDKFKPSDKAILGYHLSEPAFYDLAQRYHNDEDIRRELSLGLLEGGNTNDIEFVFEDGKISDRTYYYAENLRHSLHTEKTEDGYKCSFGGMERFVSFEEIGQAFIDRTHEEFEDLMYWRVLDYIRDDIPDISDDTVRALISAFDGAAMADWEKGDNLPKINRIKKALYDILGDEQQTEKAFACIAKQKYNVNFEAKKTKSSIHFGLLGNGITAYDVSRTDPETHDYPTVAHISPEGVVKIYDNSISAEDMEHINEQARLSREKFMNDWNMLSPVQQFQSLYDRADISTTVNIGKEKLSMEEKIEKYMPFVFFGEGERPEPQMEEQVKGTYKIYQLPNGEKYHGIRFESKEQLEKDEVQLNHEDYGLVYEGEIDDFKGNATLEAIFTQFNTAYPADFSGHSLSVSDVIVISADGKESAYYCDSFGFVEMPEFFKEKELLQEKSAVHEITFLGNRNGFDAVKSAANYKSFGTTVSDGDTLTVVINDNADVRDVRRLVETAQDNGVYLNVPSAKMLESRFGEDFMQKTIRSRESGLSVVNTPETKKVHQVITNAGFDGGIDDKMEYATVDEAIKAGREYISDGYLGFSVFNKETKAIEHTEGDFPLDEAFNPNILRINGMHEMANEVQARMDHHSFETPLDKAKYLINTFCEAEYRDGADFSNLHNVSIAYTTLTDDELPIQVTADLIDFKITYEFDGEIYNTEQYDSIEDMIENGLTGLDFSELVSVPDSLIEKHTAKNEQTIISPEIEASSDIDKPLFTDSAVIEEIQRNEHSDTPFWETPDIQGEQLTLFGDPEPIQQKKPEKPKSEFAKGPVVDGVQVYEALAAEIDRGTGFVNGKFRVQDFYEEKHPTVQQLADFLKKEYGIGGHSGEGKISLVDYDSKGMTFSFENGEKFRHSWYNVAVMAEARLKDDTYLFAEQKAERDALKKEQSAEETDKKVVFEMLGGGKLEFKDDKMETLAEIELSNGKITYFSDNLSETDKAYIAEKSEQFRTEEKNPDIPTVKNLAQLKKALKAGMQFEITDHTRPECIGERRVVTGVTTVDFTSRKLDENGEPTGKDIHMEFDRAKNWNFDGSELTSRLDNGDVLMSFHFIDDLEHTATKSLPEVEHIEDAPIPDKGENFTITDDSLGDGGAKAKFRTNVEAVKALKKFESANLKLAADMFLPRPARAEEKEIMSKYVGWGALAQAFDPNNEKWATEYKELAELLTPEEYRQARASVNDAFYTSPTIIDSIYEALSNFGFDGGNILEPAMGVGNFFGRMPEDMQKNSQLYGVEIDSISGRIAQAIYPDADIAVKGFEQNTFQNGCFDVAVGNVPFGDLGFVDSVHGTSKLHDYFFAESLDKLKNGGIMAFVTSAGTLDKRDETTRQMLADKADFIGAIRLPGGRNGAFKDNAGTEVTTDIIFLQKHEGKSVAEMSDTPDWVHIGETTDGLPINKYFEQHPDMVLGTVVEGNKLYGSGTMVVAEDGFDLKSALHDAVSKLSATISPEKGRDVYAKTTQGEQVQIPSNLRNYSFFMSDDQVYFKKNNAACEFRFDKGTAQHKRFKAFIELRDLTRELLEAQEIDKPDSVIKDLQTKLNATYDDFYKKYGFIHSQTNKRYFSEDVSYNLVAGLEKKYDKTKLVEKSDIFTKRTIVPPKAVDHVETALEALTLSAAEKARVDFAYMNSLTGMTEDELKHDLQGEIFKVPHTENTYQTASEYLSGDIRKKLREAEEIAEYDADFNVNVSALKAAMPEPLKAGDIDVKIGATWINPKYYEQFLYELLQTPEYYRSDSPAARWNKSSVIGVEYSEHTNSFHVSRKSSDRSVLATQKYGSHKMNAYDIFEHILNLQEPKVYKTIEVPDDLGDMKEKRVVDIDATRIVQRKADNIRKAFKDWIFKDPARREDIVNRYNELFNSIRPREYDGSALSFPMMTTDIQLHEHQKNAIAHALFGGNTLFAHSVGAGKTFEMIATAMESKRLGLCTKSLFAVPNHLTEQIGDDFQKLYPSANILVATKKDFKKENRQQLFAKIATGNFDAVIIGHSQLGMIPVSKERQVMTIQSQIDDILQGIAELKRSEGSKFQIKAMERTRKSLQKQLDKLEKANQDDTLTFEQLGVDRLFLDEMHEFKNLFVSTKLNNVAGISNSASQKALDLFLKVRYLDEKTGNRGFIGATGTPLSNSITELHTMMRYLEYDFLRDHGLQHFDNWVSVFGEQKTDWELAPAGNKFKERTRIANYTGLPELMSMFKQVADIRTADTLQLDVPDCEYKVVQVEATPFQQELVQELSDRADAINSGNVDPTIDNMLKIVRC